MKLEPEPLVQLVPLSVLYSQLAPTSIFDTLTLPKLLMPSLVLFPLSEPSTMDGDAGGVVSVPLIN